MFAVRNYIMNHTEQKERSKYLSEMIAFYFEKGFLIDD